MPIVRHRFNFRADWGAVDGHVLTVEPPKTLSYLGGLWSRERRHLDSHSHEDGDPCAHGAVGLPAGSATGLPGRQGRVAKVLCGPRKSRGADGLKPAGSIQRKLNETLKRRRRPGAPLLPLVMRSAVSSRNFRQRGGSTLLSELFLKDYLV